MRLRGWRDIRAASAVLLQRAEPGRSGGQADRWLGARHPPRGRWQAGRQVESAAPLQAHTRHKRPDGIVARDAGPGPRQVPAQRQRKIRVLRLEDRDRFCEGQRRLLRLSGGW